MAAGYTTLDKRVFSAKSLPKIISPAKNKVHVMRVISRSTLRAGRVALKIMAILETPPVTTFMGMIKTAVPKARISVPMIIKVIFFENNDVITNSKNDAADDLGGWNSDWFTQNNG